jgi:hypothetical protein
MIKISEGKTAMPKAGWAVATIVLATVVVVLVVPASRTDTSSGDAYTKHANRLCQTAVQQIVAAGRRYNSASLRRPLGSFAESLARIVGDVRARLGTLAPPVGRIEAIVSMEGAMLESENRLIQVAQGRGRAATRARLAVAASTRVDEAASSAGLAECARLSLAVAPAGD